MSNYKKCKQCHNPNVKSDGFCSDECYHFYMDYTRNLTSSSIYDGRYAQSDVMVDEWGDIINESGVVIGVVEYE